MSAESAGAPLRIGLPPAQFAAAFPFHFAVDESLTILQVGRTLRRVCPDVLPGARCDVLFRAVRPQGQIRLDWIVENRTRFFLLENVASSLQLRGAFAELPGEGKWLFLGSPWLTDAAEITARGLNFGDFAIHDPVVDLLQVFQASKMALADARRLAGKLTAQREELRAANERLRGQELESRRLALIAARTDNAVVLTDADRRIVWINDGFTRMTGYALEEVAGRRPGAVLQGPATDPATVQRIREKLGREEGFNEEILNYRKDGSEFWSAIEVQPIRDEKGQLVNYMSIQSDVTERRNSQRRLAIQYQVAALLAASDDLSAALQGLLQAVCGQLGWQLGQVWRVAGNRLRLAETWRPAPEQCVALVESSRAMQFKRGEGYPGRVWATASPCWIRDVATDQIFLRATGAGRDGLHGAFAAPVLVRGEVWGVVEFFSARLEEPDDALLQTFATIGVQIGALVVRWEAQQALRQSEERFRSAFEDAHAGIALVGLDSRFVRVNPAFCELVGYDTEELVGRSFVEITHPEDAGASEQAFRQLLSWQAERIELEKRYVRKDGRVIWVLLRVRRQGDSIDGPGLFVGHFLDITARKEAEQALRREKQLLEQAQQRELQTGYEIQRSLLIGDLPTGIAGADIAAYAEPSRGIDGDFYAFTRFRPDCFELLVGDVMGKGVPAALVGAAVRTTYNQALSELVASARGGGGLPTPASIVDALHERLTPRLIELDTFVTLALYRFDLADDRLVFVNAGHTPGLLLGSSGAVERLLGENMPLGVLEEERYVETVRPVHAGEALLVYSDGITEARNTADVEFGEARLGSFLRELHGSQAPARIGLQLLRKRVRDFVGERTMPDDETAVLIGLHGPAGSLEAPDPLGNGEEIFDLPWRLAALEPVRRRVALAAAGLGEEARDRLVLAAFEAATNVVRHVAAPYAGATLTCRLRREAQQVIVQLWYLGPPFAAEGRAPADLSGESEGGFGLHIIEQAVSRVSYEQPLPEVCCTRLVQQAEGATA